MLRRLHEIAVDDPDAGGKAAGLARLAAAGLPVPETLVLPAAAERAPWAEVAAALDQAFATLARPLIVRSSASCEDRAAAAAPGLFASVGGVSTRAELDQAVRTVWASLHAPIAQAYLARRGVDVAHAGMAVVLQSEQRGRAAGTIYTRRPGAPAEMIIEIADLPALLTRQGTPLTPLPASLGREDAQRLAGLALAAERAIAAEGPGADVEFVVGADADVWLVQARPIVAAAAVAESVAVSGTYEFSAHEPEVLWRWDAAHNPEPLSPAQAGLVALVDAAGVAPYRQRVVDGYLYYAERRAAPVDPIAPAELRRRYDAELRPALERALAGIENDAAPMLDRALAAYLDFYARYARLSVSLRRARDALVGWLDERLGAGAPALAATLLGAIGATHAPARVPLAWDVAAAEIDTRATRAASAASAPPVPPALPAIAAAVPAELLAHARDAAAIAEDDDVLFARAQAIVRRALAALAVRWQVALDDLLHIPLEDVRAAAAPPADLRARADVARAERARQGRHVPPFVIVAGRGLPATSATPSADGLLRGWGAGGRVRGRVHRLTSVGTQASEIAAPVGAVVVTATILPGMAVLVDGAAAIVAEHGGPLGHGAALARELGLPCVVGCAGALALLADGDEALVDGSAGLVWKL